MRKRALLCKRARKLECDCLFFVLECKMKLLILINLGQIKTKNPLDNEVFDLTQPSILVRKFSYSEPKRFLPKYFDVIMVITTSVSISRMFDSTIAHVMILNHVTISSCRSSPYSCSVLDLRRNPSGNRVILIFGGQKPCTMDGLWM